MELLSKLSNQMNEILIVDPTEQFATDSYLQVLDVDESKMPLETFLI
jgi:hypothetical protein